MALNTGLEDMFIIDTPSWSEATAALGWEIRTGNRKALGVFREEVVFVGL